MFLSSWGPSLWTWARSAWARTSRSSCSPCTGSWTARTQSKVSTAGHRNQPGRPGRSLVTMETQRGGEAWWWLSGRYPWTRYPNPYIIDSPLFLACDPISSSEIVCDPNFKCCASASTQVVFTQSTSHSNINVLVNVITRLHTVWLVAAARGYEPLGSLFVHTGHQISVAYVSNLLQPSPLICVQGQRQGWEPLPYILFKGPLFWPPGVSVISHYKIYPLGTSQVGVSTQMYYG